MIELGATSVWEEYDPTKSGDEHLEMYGAKYGKSLCHAWGSGPILLLGKYCAGVEPTSIGYKTFTVSPNPGNYSRFSATVPVRNGIVDVHYDNGKLTVRSTVDGGTLRFSGKEYALIANETLTVE